MTGKKVSGQEGKETQKSPDLIIDNEGLWAGRLLQFAKLESTNEWVKSHPEFCVNGDVIRAVRQINGRGRLSREWVSPGGRGLTLTLFIHAEDDWWLQPVVGQITALAVQQVLSRYRIDTRLKWPNDVMVNDKKVAGILMETDLRRKDVFVGIGINTNLTKQDVQSIKSALPATSMRIETDHVIDVDFLIRELVSVLENAFAHYRSKNMDRFLYEWSRNDWLKRKELKIENKNTHITGTYLGLDRKGRLRLEDSWGEVHVFWSGDIVSVRKAD